MPVLVLPGWGAGDSSTIALRSQLRIIGHPVHRWQLGRNEGPSAEVIDALSARLLDLADRYQRPVALVGWSLGGIYACHLAQRSATAVKQIITLGSPLRSAIGTAVPPQVPLTSIWSRHDRVVDWRKSAIKASPGRENIEVRATHLTLGFDPLVLTAIADRLAQRPEDWKPFRPPPWLQGVYPSRPTRT